MSTQYFFLGSSICTRSHVPIPCFVTYFEELRLRGTLWNPSAVPDAPAKQSFHSEVVASLPPDQSSSSSCSEGCFPRTTPDRSSLNNRQPRIRDPEGSVGANEESELPTVPPQPTKKTVFVSCLHTDTSVCTSKKLVTMLCKDACWLHVVCDQVPELGLLSRWCNRWLCLLCNKSSVWLCGCLFANVTVF